MQSKFSEKLTLYQIMHFMITMLCITAVYIVTSLLVKELNPDWFAYEKIFSNNGWIEDGDRDVGFLLIIDAYKSLVANDYDSFRLILAMFFLFFSLLLVAGKIIKFDNFLVAPLALLFAVLALVLIRFSIQIREGLSTVFVIFAFANIFNNIKFGENQSANENSASIFNTKIALSILLLLGAFSIHAGTTIFLGISFITLFLCLLEQNSTSLFLIGKKILWVFVFVIFCTIPFYYSKVVSDNEFFSEMVDLSNNASLTAGKISYWLFYGLMIVVLNSKVKYFSDNYLESKYSKIYIELLSGHFMFAIYCSILISLYLEIPNFILSAQIRLLNLIICLLLFLLAARTRNTLFLVLFSMFILVDQARTIVEALLTFD